MPIPPAVSRRALLRAAATVAPAFAIGGSLLGRAGDLLAAPPRSSTDFALAPELRTLAEATLREVRAAFATAAAHPTKNLKKNPLARVSQRFLAAQKPARIERARGRATALLADGPKARAAFGDYASVTASQWQASAGLDVVRQSMLEAVEWRGLAKIVRRKTKVYQEKGPTYAALEFHLNKVKCLDETNGPLGSEAGDDDIALGGVLIRPDAGVARLDPFDVGKFDDGESKVYSTGTGDDPSRGRVLVRTDIDGPWPGVYSLLLVMVEGETGELGDFHVLVSEMQSAIRAELDAALAAARDAGQLDAQTRSLISFQVSAWVVTELVTWLAGLLDTADDPIATLGWMIDVDRGTKAWFDEALADGVPAPSGQRASARRGFEMEGLGGKYRVELHYRAVD